MPEGGTTVALDPELRSYLDAIEQRMTQHTDERMAAVRNEIVAVEQRGEAKMAAIEQRAIARDAAAREEAVATRRALEGKIEEARREAGAMMESIIHEIRALPEGLSRLQRQEADRLDAAREEAMLNRHVLPLEASAASHEKRIDAMEQRR